MGNRNGHSHNKCLQQSLSTTAESRQCKLYYGVVSVSGEYIGAPEGMLCFRCEQSFMQSLPKQRLLVHRLGGPFDVRFRLHQIAKRFRTLAPGDVFQQHENELIAACFKQSGEERGTLIYQIKLIKQKTVPFLPMLSEMHLELTPMAKQKAFRDDKHQTA